MSDFLEQQNATLTNRMKALEKQFEEVKRAIEDNLEELLDDQTINVPNTRDSAYAHFVDILAYLAKETQNGSDKETGAGTIQ